MKHIIICLFLFSSVSQAQPTALLPSEAVQLSYALEIDSMIESVKKQSDESANKQINAAIDQLSKSFPKLTADQLRKLKAAGAEMIVTISSSWSSETVKQIYLQELSERMSPEDNINALQFFSSPAGKNAYIATKAAEQKMITYITSSYEKSMSEAYSRFLDDVRIIMTLKK
jgi:hypothetical protein